MKLLSSLTLALCTFGLACCASAPQNTSFDSATQNALVVIAAPVHRSSNLDVFRRVDLATGQFVGPPQVVQVDTFGALDSLIISGSQINANSAERPIALAIRSLPPGDYSWVEANRSVGSQAWGASDVMCLNEMAPVFSVAAGTISIIRVDEVTMKQTSYFAALMSRSRPDLSDQSVIAEFERARTDYPNIVGVATIAAPIAFIKWPETHAGLLQTLNRNCAEPASFERVRASQ